MNRFGSNLFIALIPAAVVVLGATAQDEIPFYVGRDVCLECHGPGQAHAACREGPVQKHEQAFADLSKPEAAHIAYLSGVAERPTESLVCLGCHTTAADAGPRWTRSTFRTSDGVQCEACHNAGGPHVAARRGDLGEQAYGDLSRLRERKEDFCKTCHVERLSHNEVLKAGYRRPAPDQLYKTPVNLAVSRAGDRLYVVCENSNSLIVVDPRRGNVLSEIAVGRRPHDVAVSPDGRTLYVTNRMSNTLTVIDAAAGARRAEVAVGSEPHGVLTDASGRRVFVLNTGDNTVSILDASALTETARLSAGHGPWSLALRPDGKSVCITNVRPNGAGFRQPPRSELTMIDSARVRVTSRPVAADANMLQGVAFIPGRQAALFTLMRTKNLVPISRLAQGWVITNGLGVLWPDGRVDQVLLDEPNSCFPDPNDVAVSPDGRTAVVTSGGLDQVAVIDVNKLLETIENASDRAREQVLPNHLGFSSRFVIKRVAVGRNPRGVAFSPDGRFAYVAAALDDEIAIIETEGFSVVRRIRLGGPDEITQTRRGERLFHNAAITFAQQFSCRSCHPDGHINGLSFDIEADGLGLKPVDNRTLRGILDTAPFKWEGTNPSLSRQCGPRLAVFFTRLDPFTPEELAALVRYICTIERPTNPRRRSDGLTPAQHRGKLIFERVATNDGKSIPLRLRCNTCHGGAYKTARTPAAVGTEMWFDAPSDDVQPFDLSDEDAFGALGIVYFSQEVDQLKPFDIPHLNNISRSAPYLHNGGAATLAEIWTRFNLYDWHGVTLDLTRRQLNDLIAYLKAL